MVARVGDDDLIIRLVDENARRGPELPRAVALRAELEQERAVGAEHLDSMVARVGDDECAVVIHGNVLRRPELAGAAAGGIVAGGRHGLGMGKIRRRGRQEQRQGGRGGGNGKQRGRRPGTDRTRAANHAGRPWRQVISTRTRPMRAFRFTASLGAVPGPRSGGRHPQAPRPCPRRVTGRAGRPR